MPKNVRVKEIRLDKYRFLTFRPAQRARKSQKLPILQAFTDGTVFTPPQNGKPSLPCRGGDEEIRPRTVGWTPVPEFLAASFAFPGSHHLVVPFLVRIIPCQREPA